MEDSKLKKQSVVYDYPNSLVKGCSAAANLKKLINKNWKDGVAEGKRKFLRFIKLFKIGQTL